MRIKYSIIIPAYNEAGRIANTLEEVSAYLETGVRQSSGWEVIVVCDGCSDNTAQVVGAFKDRLPLRLLAYRDNRGKGYAVRRGVAESVGNVVTFMDADGSTPVRELDRLAKPILQDQADIVIGSRHVENANVVFGQSVCRRILGRAFSLHTRLALGLDLHDTQCGFKVFRGDVARALFAGLRLDGFAFDLELLAEARERRLRVQERGVEWRERPGSTVHPVHDGVRMLRAAWEIRSRLRSRRRFGQGYLPLPSVHSKGLCERCPT
jgi:dolichyl-phosphate beta-glucosyltransferase